MGIAWEHGGFAHIVQSEVEEDNSVKTDAGAGVRGNAMAERVQVEVKCLRRHAFVENSLL
jgi:hypothetical protein